MGQLETNPRQTQDKPKPSVQLSPVNTEPNPKEQTSSPILVSSLQGAVDQFLKDRPKAKPEAQALQTISTGLLSGVAEAMELKKARPAAGIGTGNDYFLGNGNVRPEDLQKLTHIAGTPIAELEKRMRPGSSSESGFLTSKESLCEVLAKDHKYVTEQGYSHKQLADALKHFEEEASKSRTQPVIVELNGKKFEVAVTSYRGFQMSPFEDGTLTCCDISVKNLETGKEINYSGLMQEMIRRYGFYEGDVPYRVDPKVIIETFQLEPQTSPAKASSSNARSNLVLPPR